jgi:hypothetical protein
MLDCGTLLSYNLYIGDEIMNTILKILAIIDLILFGYMSYKLIVACQYIADVLPSILALM